MPFRLAYGWPYIGPRAARIMEKMRGNRNGQRRPGKVTGPTTLAGRPCRHLDTVEIAGSQEADKPTALSPNGEPDPKEYMDTRGASDSETKAPHGSMHFSACHTRPTHHGDPG